MALSTTFGTKTSDSEGTRPRLLQRSRFTYVPLPELESVPPESTAVAKTQNTNILNEAGFEFISHSDMGDIDGIGDFRDGTTLLFRKETDAPGTYLYIALYRSSDPGQAMLDAAASLRYSFVSPDHPYTLHYGLADANGDHFDHLGLYGQMANLNTVLESIDKKLPEQLFDYQRTIFREELGSRIKRPEGFDAGQKFVLPENYEVKPYTAGAYNKGGFTVKAGTEIEILGGGVELSQWPEQDVPQGGLVSVRIPKKTGRLWKQSTIIKGPDFEEDFYGGTHICFTMPAEVLKPDNLEADLEKSLHTTIEHDS